MGSFSGTRGETVPSRAELAEADYGASCDQRVAIRGLFQEQGLVQRAVDEIGEDVIFLSFGVINDDMTPRHQEYLKHFYAEEFEDPTDIVGSHASRGMVKRDKIRAYMTDALGPDSSRANAVGRVMTKTYSGYVHAASPHIMDMCFGDPARFDITGLARDYRVQEHARDALNYFYRSLGATTFAAKAFGDEALVAELLEVLTALEQKMLDD